MLDNCAKTSGRLTVHQEKKKKVLKVTHKVKSHSTEDISAVVSPELVESRGEEVERHTRSLCFLKELGKTSRVIIGCSDCSTVFPDPFPSHYREK